MPWASTPCSAAAGCWAGPRHHPVGSITDIKPGGVRSLDQVKDEIATEIKKQLAAKKYTEMAETFSNTVYEQADSLKPVSDKLGLKVESVNITGREPKPELGKDAPYNNAKFLAALFADEAVRNKHNTEAVEVAPNTLVAGRVVSYQPRARRPLEEVKAQVRELVLQQEAMALAKKAGETRLAELQTRTDANGFSAARMVSRTAAGNLDESALFYMQQRGIPADEAKALLTQAFLIEVVDRIEHEAAREVVREWLTARL